MQQIMKTVFHGMLAKILLTTAMLVPMVGMSAFQCKVHISSGEIGESRTATVTYSNDGSYAISAPYVRLEAGDNA